MVTEILWNLMINGLIVGSVYAIVGVGLTLTFGVLEVVNYAHAEFYMLGAYLTLFFTENIGSYELAVVCAIVIVAMVGMMAERVVIRPVVDKGWRLPIASTIGLMIVIQNLVIYVWTCTPKMIKTIHINEYLNVLGAKVTFQHILVLTITPIIFIFFHLFLMKTKTGKAMRALSQNKEACRVFGIKPSKIYSLTFAIGGGLCGLAGGLVGPLYVLYPTMGTLIIFKCFAVVIMGGFGNIKGAIASAYILGIAESLFAGCISYAWKDMLAFVLLAAFLIFKPHGMFGKKVGI